MEIFPYRLAQLNSINIKMKIVGDFKIGNYLLGLSFVFFRQYRLEGPKSFFFSSYNGPRANRL